MLGVLSAFVVIEVGYVSRYDFFEHEPSPVPGLPSLFQTPPELRCNAGKQQPNAQHAAIKPFSYNEPFFQQNISQSSEKTLPRCRLRPERRRLACNRRSTAAREGLVATRLRRGLSASRSSTSNRSVTARRFCNCERR